MIIGICAIDLSLNWVNYAYKQTFALPNILLALTGLFILYIVFTALEKTHIELTICFFSLLLFIFQIYISCNAYFKPGFDAAIILQAARDISAPGGVLDQFYSRYLSFYPNNALQLVIESHLLRLHQAFGILPTGDGIMSVIVLQAAVNCLTGELIYRCILKLTDHVYSARLGWIIYLMLLGTSGWVFFPYTDSCGLLFPVLIFWLYLNLQDNWTDLFKWTGIFLLGYWGYQIKPTVGITLIAIGVVELMDTFGKERNKFLWLIIVLVLGIFLTAGSSEINRKLIRSCQIEINPNLILGVRSNFMMGLNHEMDGAYYDPLSDMMHSISDPVERKQAEDDEIRRRISSYGLDGFIVHTVRKILVNFNDGSYAWMLDGVALGDFTGDETNTVAKPIISHIYCYPASRLNHLFLALKQMTWLVTLILIPLFLFDSLQGKSTAKYQQEQTVGGCLAYKPKLLLALNLIGSILFVLLFEARARYLYCMIPFYIISGSLGAPMFELLVSTGIQRTLSNVVQHKHVI